MPSLDGFFFVLFKKNVPNSAIDSKYIIKYVLAVLWQYEATSSMLLNQMQADSASIDLETRHTYT